MDRRHMSMMRLCVRCAEQPLGATLTLPTLVLCVMPWAWTLERLSGGIAELAA